MIKAVIFDIGGTLFYSDKVANDHHQAAGQAVLDYLKKHHININVDASTFAAKWVEGSKKFKNWTKLHNDIDCDPYFRLSKFILLPWIKSIDQTTLKLIANNTINVWKSTGDGKIRPEAKAVLKKLSKKYKLGIISNTDSLDFVLLRLFNNDIYHYFDPNCIYLSCKSQMRKPQKEIFLAACEDLNVKPSETVYIGDTISRDVSGSNNAKLAACFRIGSTLTTNADNGTKSPDTKYVITSLKDIIKLLKDTPFI